MIDLPTAVQLKLSLGSSAGAPNIDLAFPIENNRARVNQSGSGAAS